MNTGTTNAAPRCRTSYVAPWLILGAFAWLLTFRLGDAPLWSDEADTALFARGVWETGDTSALVGENLYAFRNGTLLTGLHNRFTPPLPYYVAAPFVGLFGADTFWLRFPFALCGWLTVALVCWWLWSSKADARAWWLLGAALLGNAAITLFSRQCRYYPLAMLASTGVAYFYLNHRGRRAMLLGWSASSLVLLTTQYLNFAALWAACIVDYLGFERKRRPLTWRQLLGVLAPQWVVGLLMATYWNPLGRDTFTHVADRNWLADHGTLLWWNLRDACEGEMLSLAVLALAPCIAVWKRDPWLVRIPLALVAYVATIALFSPQPVALTTEADIRYLVPIVPLALALAWRELYVLVPCPGWLTFFLAAWLLLTNAAYDWRCVRMPDVTQAKWIRAELGFQRRSSRRPALADWMVGNLPRGTTVWVAPDYDQLGPAAYNTEARRRMLPVSPLAYSLMVYAPQAVFAWQLSPPLAPQFAGLPPIHTSGLEPVDVLISTGGASTELVEHVRSVLEREFGASYVAVNPLPAEWFEVRPDGWLLSHRELKPKLAQRLPHVIYRRLAR